MPMIYDLGIIGMGPAGIGMAASLHNTDMIKSTVCFERGSFFSNGRCAALLNNDCCSTDSCSIISGIGGASVCSSGKISDYPAGSGLVKFFDSEQQLKDLFNKVVPYLSKKINLNKVEIDGETIKNAESFYFEKDITYKYYDVYEFDAGNYRNFISETIQQLKEEGLQIFDNTEVVDISYSHSPLYYSIKVKSFDGKTTTFRIRNLVLATGALDLQDVLIEKIGKQTSKHYEIGVRIEAPTNAFGKMLLTHGDIKLKQGIGRTYCVTVDGKIIVYQTAKMLFLEGFMEPSKPTGFTNLAVLIKSDAEKDIYDFLNSYCNEYSGYPIKQKLIDYMNERISSE